MNHLAWSSALLALVACSASSPSTPRPTAVVAFPTISPDESTPGTVRVWEKDSAPMVFVPSGYFMQGAPLTDKLSSDNERPQHAVYVTGFWIDQTEVTNARYAACVATGVCRPPMSNASHSRDTYYGNLTYADYPVIFVSWFDAKNYCEWSGKLLPTEAEWERAARGSDSRRYPWGDEWDGAKANFCDESCPHRWRDRAANDGYVDTARVGSYPAGASPFGVLDMGGNVWEWVTDGFMLYSADPQVDPVLGTSEPIKILRGGAHDFVSAGLRSTYRYEDDGTHRQDSFGFRCAASK